MVLVVRNAFYMGEVRRGEVEAEAEATAARRGGSRGGATAAPRRPRAAGISDAFIGQRSLNTTNDH